MLNALFLAATLASGLHHELLPYDPRPNPASLVWSPDGAVLFTVLTPHLVRIQKGPIDDRATLAVVHRNLPTPAFHTNVDASGTFVLRTTKIEVYYSSKGLSGLNLASQQRWEFGAAPTGNLWGTIRTLDALGPTSLNCTAFTDPDAHCEWGLVSRDGWAVIDDSDGVRLDGPNDWHTEGGHEKGLDSYLFMHGFEFKQAVADYSLIGGKIPLPSKFMFGVLWTRWYDFDAGDLKALVSGFSVRGLPLDVLILDMNWHKKPWWGGYTFDERLIPNWKRLIQWIHERGVSVGLNVHDCLLSEPGCPSGTLSSDDVEFWGPFFEASKTEPASGQTTVPLDLVNETLALAKEDVVIQSFEGWGDLWWIDWQQGGAVGGLPGGKCNPTIWLNKMRYTNRNRWNDDKILRGSVLSRFGGLGSHRYGLGFSGDVQMLDWENLSYQPFFTATAANVLFSSWSHDVTGPNRDPELFVRWTQWAAFSGVLRFHERGMSSGPCAFSSFPLPSKECANVDLWANLPHRFAHAIREATLLRAKLVPYTYTAAVDAFESGIPWIRPLYYEFPHSEEAYTQGGQYMFGDDITVAPIVGPSDVWAPTSTEWSIFVPPGRWYSPIDGAVIEGPRTITRHWDLLEIPHLVKAGAVIATRFVDPTVGSQKLVGLAKTNFTDLVFTIAPGADSGSTHVAEDDGETVNYLHGQSGKVLFNYTRTNSSSVITVGVRVVGEFSKSIFLRTIRIAIPDVALVAVVACSTKKPPTVGYEGAHVMADVAVEWDLAIDGPGFEISFRVPAINLSGARGAIAHARYAKAALDEVVLTPGTHPCWHGMPCGYRPQDDNLILVASMGERLEHVQAGLETDTVEWANMLVSRYRECVAREVTVDNLLRVDTAWAPTQGGWPEATRLRVNYAVASIYGALDSLCLLGFEMPLVCHHEVYTDKKEVFTERPYVSSRSTAEWATVILVNQ